MIPSRPQYSLSSVNGTRLDVDPLVGAGVSRGVCYIDAQVCWWFFSIQYIMSE